MHRYPKDYAPPCQPVAAPARRPVLVAAAAVLTVIGLAGGARADSVKFGSGLELQGVELEIMAEGKVSFVNAGGVQVTRPLEELVLVKMSAYPDLGEGEDLLAKGKNGAALAAFQKARAAAVQKWLHPWIESRMVATYDKLGQPVEAINLYLRMARAKSDPAFLMKLPTHGLVRLNKTTKANMLALIDTTLRELATAPQAEPVTKLKEAVAELDLDRVAALVQAGVDPLAQTAPTAPKSQIPLPRSMIVGTKDPVSQLLMKGQFDTALAEVKKRLETETSGVWMRLYQMGVAELYLAEKSNDANLYKDAGLALMRIVVLNTRSSYYGPALLEAGRVHQMIGRPDLARELYDKAGVAIDPEAEPELAARLEKLKAELTQSK